MIDSHLPELLTLLDVQRVVVVDDSFLPSWQVMLAFAPGEGPDLEGLPALPKDMDYDEHLAEHWPSVPTAAKIEARNLARKVEGEGEQADPTGVRRLIGDRPFRGMTLFEWTHDGKAVLRGAKRALILFDVDFKDEDPQLDDEAGLDPAGRALKENTQHIVGLLTTNTSAGGEGASADAWASRADVDRANLVVVNKNLINGEDDAEDVASAVEQIRTALQASQLRRLRETVQGALTEGLERAFDQLKQRSPTVLEDLVFNASLDGGEWEGDTWFRLYGTLGFDRARREVALDKAARRAIFDIRGLLRSRPSEPHGDSEALAREVEQAESYADADYLNQAGLPIVNGDFFENKDGQVFVLVGQPCDLTLRPGGRSRKPQTATLLPVRSHTADADRESSGYRLPAGAPLGEGEWEVRFRPEYHVAFDVLDLVSFNTEGRATLTPPKRSVLAPLLPGLAARHGVIASAAAKIAPALERIDALRKSGDITAAITTQLRMGVLHGGGPFRPTLNGTPTPYAFHCRRIGRLSGTYADALLAAHSGARARTAHAHELTRIVADSDV
jgi:hypothetical protein